MKGADEQAITFTDEDAERVHHLHDDVIVITLLIAGYTTRRVLVDNGSSTNILYYLAFQQMRLGRDQLRPVNSPLIGFGKMKVQLVGQVQEDQLAAREYYLAMLAMDEHKQMMSIDERRVTAEPTKVLEDIPRVEGNPGKFTKIGTSMKEKTKQDPVQFLRKSIDVFTWSHEDMLGINLSVITHRLNVHLSSKPVHQKKRVFAPKRDNSIKEEVQKLTTAKFIWEVYYSDWLANVVMLVDSIVGHKLLSLMDAFSDGQNVEVYVDDILVKSLGEEKHLEDLQETFDTLRRHNMKLNPRKCAFGVLSGKFLGFIVSHRGIEANPDKIQAILNMEPPRNVKEIKSLTG
ncbi:uncharacterized protein LOC142612306 [Castanea sativa]|uniref:uncharacterized protein LOC142612306 n=1 Tax=Castanea sativa TaxID=21020 RepID=UPI003F64B5A4